MGDDNAPLVEPIPVHDTFISGVARVDRIGADLYRLTFFADGVNTFDGRPERTVVARFVIGGGTILRCSQYVIGQLTRTAMLAANG